MSPKPVFLIDRSGHPVAALDVADAAGVYRGTVALEAPLPALRALFAEFEDAVEGQLFPLADEIEDRIAAASLSVRLDDGTTARVRDLQLFPSSGRVSFRLA